MSKQNNVGAGPVSARNKQNGITLIALIITIIVMLILVGVTVSVSLNGGLFSKAKEAGNKTKIAAEKDILANLALGALDNKGKVNFADLKIAVDTNGTFEEVASSEEIGVYASKKIENQYYTVKSDGTIIEGKTEIPTAKWVQNGDTLTYVGADGVATNKTLTIGQSINYDEGTTGSYTTEEDRGTYATSGKTQGTYTVDGANGTIAAGDLEWVVLGVNEAGQVELISTEPTSKTLTLYGKAGYENAITDENGNLGTLDTFCNNLYGQNKNAGAISARSINLEDLYKAAGKDYVISETEYTYKYYEGDFYRIKTSNITADNKDNISGWSRDALVWSTSYDTPSGFVSSENVGPISVFESDDVIPIPCDDLPLFLLNLIGHVSEYYPHDVRFIMSTKYCWFGCDSCGAYHTSWGLKSNTCGSSTAADSTFLLGCASNGPYTLSGNVLPIVTLNPDSTILFN